MDTEKSPEPLQEPLLGSNQEELRHREDEPSPDTETDTVKHHTDTDTDTDSDQVSDEKATHEEPMYTSILFKLYISGLVGLLVARPLIMLVQSWLPF